MSIYESEAAVAPIKEGVYTFQNNTVEKNDLSVERGGTYYMYLQYYKAKTPEEEKKSEENKPEEEKKPEEKKWCLKKKRKLKKKNLKKLKK